MPDRNDEELDPEIIPALLGMPTSEEQSAFLLSKGLLQADGFFLLLQEAAQLVGGDPAQARQLAELVENHASSRSIVAVIPRARYIRAQTHAINAEYEIALELIAAARQGYEELEQPLPALRTNLGRIHVLQEIGRYQEALEAGALILKHLPDLGQPEQAEMAANAHQNMGRCYEQMGRYEEALNAYAATEQLLLALDMPDRIADISNNRGIVYLNLGRGQDALQAFQQAAQIFAENQETVYEAQARINIGDACLMVGNYTQGLEAFEHARRLLADLQALADKQVLLLDMADAYLALNLYAEALNAYREADGLLQSTGMTHDRARALMGMGGALIAQLKYEEAGQVLAESEALFSGTQNTPMLSGVMLEQAGLLAIHGQQGAAYNRAQAALALVADTGWLIQQVNAYLRLADLAPGNRSLMHLQQAQKLLTGMNLPHLRFRLDQRLGRMKLQLGEQAEARQILEAAAREMENSRGVLAHEMIRASFIRDKAAIYDDLLQLHLAGQGVSALEQAFAVVERAKSRTLVDMLTGMVNLQTDSSDHELIARLKVSQGELSSLYNKVMSSSDKEEVLALSQQALQLEQEINRLRLQMAANPAEHLDPLTVPADAHALAAEFPADLTLIEYYTCGQEVLAFVRSKGTLHVTRNLCQVEEIQQQLQKLALQWDRFRGGMNFVARHLPQLELSTRRILASLHDGLIASLSTFLPASASENQVPRLVIVPHGPLHQVPFHALFDGEQYLIDRYEISYAPSQTVWRLCQKREPLHVTGSLVMGISDTLIPHAEREAGAVARQMGVEQVYTDSAATLSAFQAQAPVSQFVHLACHGLFRADNPMFSALKLHDGWLMAADILQMDLTGALIALSACESGRSQVLPGDEVIGLTRAFLGAGASTLVVSLWLVQDETTAVLMETWYKNLSQGRNRSEALRVAQLAIKAEYPHPYYWAPFILVGKS